MARGNTAHFLRCTPTVVLLIACGGTTSVGSPGSGGAPGADAAASGGSGGGSGGTPAATGGAPAALPDCDVPLATGTSCTQPSARCGGPCSNSWQAENVCQNGK